MIWWFTHEFVSKKRQKVKKNLHVWVIRGAIILNLWHRRLHCYTLQFEDALRSWQQRFMTFQCVYGGALEIFFINIYWDILELVKGVLPKHPQGLIIVHLARFFGLEHKDFLTIWDSKVAKIDKNWNRIKRNWDVVKVQSKFNQTPFEI